MEFSNLYFLYIWLPLILLVYVLAREMRWKNYFLLGFSLFFYAMGQPIYMAMLVGLSYLNFRMALKIRRDDRMSVVTPIAVNIAVLAIFKYLDFILGILGIHTDEGVLLTILGWIIGWLNRIGFDFEVPATVVPIGISFYTFSLISYLLDVYREKVAPERSFRKLLMYLTMFPKIHQGPIVRYEQVDFQLAHRRNSSENVFAGGLRFTIGLAKKVLLADYCGRVIADVASLGCEGTFVGAWLSAVLFMFQIYFDFSGYSDMAIGLGRIFGFTFCENFDLPYLSRSVTEFWRRWHISLGSFFRDYVYIPLGGNRMGWKRQILNLLLVWSLTGLWHGANWNYVLWGLYFFGVLVAEKYYGPALKKLPVLLQHTITMAVVFFGWVLFAHEDPGSLATALCGFLGFGGFTGTGVGLKLLNSLPLIAVCWIGCTGLPRLMAARWRSFCGMDGPADDTVTPRKAVYAISGFLLMAVLLWLCTVSMVGGTSAPSIYGNF